MSLIIEIITKILKALLNSKSIVQKQNYWNPPEAEENAEKVSENRVVHTIDTEKRPSKKEGLVHPVKRNGEFKITSPYGWRYLNIGGKKKKQFHIGIDVSSGTNVAKAVEDVVIEKVLNIDEEYPVRFEWDNKNKTWQNVAPQGRAWTPYVIARSMRNKNVKYKYKHVNPSVQAGEIVKRNTSLGECGNYGYSMGPHLHFEVWVDGKHVNPQRYLENNLISS